MYAYDKAAAFGPADTHKAASAANHYFFVI